MPVTEQASWPFRSNVPGRADERICGTFHLRGRLGVVYLLNVAASSATKPASPAQVLRLVLALAASTAHSRAPVPAAISEASVKVGM